MTTEITKERAKDIKKNDRKTEILNTYRNMPVINKERQTYKKDVKK